MIRETQAAGSKLTAVQSGKHLPTAKSDLELSMQRLNEHKDEWAALPLREIIRLFEAVLQNLILVADEWVEKDIQNRGLTPAHWDAAVSYFGGPIMTIHTLRAYLQSLKDIEHDGKPRIPGKITTKSNGQVAVQVYPTSLYEKILFTGFKGEVWLDPGIKVNDHAIAQANNYLYPKRTGKVALVLGAGNVSALTINDTYHQLINERNVVLIKVHPVTEYLGELLIKIFAPLIQRGFLQVVYGGAAEGVYLCQHELIEAIHITGSDKTYENIVYGSGDVGEQNKRNRQPMLTKQITSELGNVTPAIIIPGPWTQADIEYQAENLATTMTVNSGFNCISTRVIIQHESWQLRSQLMDKLCEQLQHIPLCKSYYPGAQKRISEIVSRKPEAKQIGIAQSSESPWTVIQNLDAENNQEECFSAEVFGGFTTETAQLLPTIHTTLASDINKYQIALALLKVNASNENHPIQVKLNTMQFLQQVLNGERPNTIPKIDPAFEINKQNLIQVVLLSMNLDQLKAADFQLIEKLKALPNGKFPKSVEAQKFDEKLREFNNAKQNTAAPNRAVPLPPNFNAQCLEAIHRDSKLCNDLLSLTDFVKNDSFTAIANHLAKKNFSAIIVLLRGAFTKQGDEALQSPLDKQVNSFLTTLKRNVNGELTDSKQFVTEIKNVISGLNALKSEKVLAVQQTATYRGNR